jgi:multidrug efflux pump subunit AcrA (membrane-fusion protein)
VTSPPSAPSLPPVAPVEFPESITEGSGPDWRRRAFTAAVLAIAVALVAGVGVARASGSSTSGYRTATVSTQNVESVLTGVGSIEPVAQASVTFPVGGTVATVDVSVGQSIGTGQQLASLDTQSLTTALNQKQTALATAQLALSKALSGSSSTPSTGSSGTTSSGTASSGSSGSSPSGSTAVSDAQRAVVEAQRAVDHSLSAADQALAEAQQVCSAPGPGPTTTSTTSTSTTSTTVPGGRGGTDPCLAAQQKVASAQARVATDQKALSTATASLADAVTQQASSGTGSSSRASTGSSSTSSAAGTRTGATGGSGTSAADLIADQAAVDAAAAEVAVAQQNLAATTIVSPISGTVAAVNLTVGSSVTAGSTTANVIVVGQGGMEVTTPVGVDQIADVKVGQRGTVLPDGATTPLPGQVVAIALTPTTSARGATYTVTIGLDDQGTNLFNGSTATVAITTAGATSVLAVPTSAVQANGTARTVTVLDGTTTSTVTVKTGVVGSQWTQITDGLTAGQVVVIADLSQPLPGSATASTNGQTTTTNRTGAGNFPGAGGGGGFRPNG